MTNSWSAAARRSLQSMGMKTLMLPKSVILLGASNLTLALPRLWHGLIGAWPEPLEMFAADGHGRSYGNWSRVGPRGLPGIVSCHLWDELNAQPSTPSDRPRALIADIGNDLLYGAEPEQIAAWVETCLQRLFAINARIVVTGLPVASIQKLSRSRFEFMKLLMFPGSRLRFDEVESKLTRLNQLVADLARTYHAVLVEKRGEWYGFDPIHIRRRFRATAWREILASWFDLSTEVDFSSVGINRSLRLWRQRPLERCWLGRIQHAVQPALREPDGTSLWLF